MCKEKCGENLTKSEQQDAERVRCEPLLGAPAEGEPSEELLAKMFTLGFHTGFYAGRGYDAKRTMEKLKSDPPEPSPEILALMRGAMAKANKCA